MKLLAFLNQYNIAETTCFPAGELVSISVSSQRAVFYIAPHELCDFKQLVPLETALERSLNIPEVVVAVIAKLAVPEFEPPLAELGAWLVKHARQAGGLMAKLFATGQLSAQTEGEWAWVLPQGIIDMLQAEEWSWFADFWQDYAPVNKTITLNAAARTSKTEIAFAFNKVRAPEPTPQPQQVKPKPVTAPSIPEQNTRVWGKSRSKSPLLKLADVNHEINSARLRGWVSQISQKLTKTGKALLKFALCAETMAVTCLLWLEEREAAKLCAKIKDQYVEVLAKLKWDDCFEHDYTAAIVNIDVLMPPLGRQDLAPRKRVELHCHSRFSSKDALASPRDLVRLAAEFGHSAIALTDHGVVQGFPEAVEAQRNLKRAGKSIKVILGLEGYLVDDGLKLCYGLSEADLDCVAGVLALALEEGEQELYVYARLGSWQGAELEFHSELRFTLPLAQELGLSAAQAASLHDLAKLSQRCLMLHEDSFAVLDRLRSYCYLLPASAVRAKFNPLVIDLPAFATCLDAEPCCFRQATWLELSLEQRTLALGELFTQLWQQAGVANLRELNCKYGWQSYQDLRQSQAKSHHIIILAADELGLYNLYRLVSLANLSNFYKKPRLPRSMLRYHRSGLIFGSACVAGEIYSELLCLYRDSAGDLTLAKQRLLDSPLLQLARFYDYLEVQPLCNNLFLIGKADSGITSNSDLQAMNLLVLELGKLTKLPTVATCDVHFMQEEDGIYRQIILNSLGYEEAEEPAPLYLRTTAEMLAEFAYMGADVAQELVVTNPNKIADLIKEDLLAFPQGLYPPIIAEADQELRRITWAGASQLYECGGQIPESIVKRIKHELDAIIGNGYAVMYYIAHALVKKSNDDGYIVGSRGSVGSSVVATFCGITEVNPLPPHYVCPQCHYYEADLAGAVKSGYDLPAQNCPLCGHSLRGEGQNIPFETFMGFKGNKLPDIDLNFSGDYQSRAHAFIEEMFGSEHTFRAGTVSAYAEATSRALVLDYFAGREQLVGRSRINHLSNGLIGVKTSTGQHPGGIVVVPKDREIYDFTPIQHPAEKAASGVITTHFDFHALHETILKFDVLGHDDPSMLKMLGDICSIRVEDIPLPDAQVMSLFHSTLALGIEPERSASNCATIGLPEVGTMIARDMIRETKPSCFHDLIQISGLSHGTNVWKDNAQDLIRSGQCSINEVIGCRDSIMTGLLEQNVPKEDAFAIMEAVRKGRGLNDKQEQLMRAHGIPNWYIKSCQKIEYLFPKAHAAAYMISTLRIAWFKVYQPEAFYCAWFTVRADEFSAEDCLHPYEIIKAKAYEGRKQFASMDKGEQKKFYILELVEEMQQRGIDFLPLDIHLSQATQFYSPSPKALRPPLNCIPGISSSLAKQICQARDSGGSFRDCAELQRRAALGEVAMQSLRNYGLLQDLPESDQIDLFSLTPEFAPAELSQSV